MIFNENLNGTELLFSMNQGFQYFSIIPVLHYLQVVRFI